MYIYITNTRASPSCSSLNIGFFEQYLNYGTFAQEIAVALNSKENEAFVKGTLLPMVMGSSATVGTEASIAV